MVNNWNNNISGWWFQTCFFFPFHIWDVILPIDELHHFSRWLLHHQPENLAPTSLAFEFRGFRGQAWWWVVLLVRARHSWHAPLRVKQGCPFCRHGWWNQVLVGVLVSTRKIDPHPKMRNSPGKIGIQPWNIKFVRLYKYNWIHTYTYYIYIYIYDIYIWYIYIWYMIYIYMIYIYIYIYMMYELYMIYDIYIYMIYIYIYDIYIWYIWCMNYIWYMIYIYDIWYIYMIYIYI